MGGGNRLLDDLRSSLAGHATVRLALLFGSQARGTAGPDSDVDVAIEAAATDGPAVAARLSAVCGREVDVITLKDPSIPLLEALVRDGQVFYEASPGAGARWRSRALASLELDRAWYARMRDAWLARVAREGL